MKQKMIATLLGICLCFSMVMGGNTLTFANDIVSTSQKQEDVKLKEAYDEILTYALNNGIPFKMEYQQFLDEYEDSAYTNVELYKEGYYRLLKPVNKSYEPMGISSLSSIGNPFAWQYNTGLGLPKDPNYSKYKLLDSCEPGDIIYEANGGFGITGHIAMVEGKFYDEILNKYYLRVIEAIQNGVVRSVLDDDRLDMQKAHVYRVNASDEEMRQHALDFELSQLGKPYWLDFAKHTSPDTPKWYCSELAWAAYMNEGVNLETQAFFNEPGVSPRDMVNSGMMTEINVKM